jgi:hypothetical protein
MDKTVHTGLVPTISCKVEKRRFASKSKNKARWFVPKMVKNGYKSDFAN